MDYKEVIAALSGAVSLIEQLMIATEKLRDTARDVRGS